MRRYDMNRSKTALLACFIILFVFLAFGCGKTKKDDLVDKISVPNSSTKEVSFNKSKDNNSVEDNDEKTYYEGEINQKVDTGTVQHLNEEFQSLSTDNIEIKVSYDFHGQNSIFVNIKYIGTGDNVTIRSDVLKTMIKMNIIAAKYKWLNLLTIQCLKDSYINTNGYQADDKYGIIFGSQTLPEDRENIKSNDIPIDDFAGYTTRFTAHKDFLTKRDEEIGSLPGKRNFREEKGISK
jgi:hypothetical protein